MSVAEYPQIRSKSVQPKKSAPLPDVVADAEAAGTIEWVKIEDLHQDVYQRPLGQDLVDQIASNWDPAVAGAVVVSRRHNGDLYIVDGQHRIAAARQHGEHEVIARVVNGLTPREEAAWRLKGNVRRSDKSHERFQAQIAAGDPESIHIKEIVESLGGHINTGPNAKTGINGISAVERIYRKDGGTLLVRTLELIQDTFGNLDGRSVNVSMLQSVSWLLTVHTPDNPDRARLVERLGTMGVDEIDRRARNHRAVMGGAMWTNYYRSMIESYNERLAAGKKLDLRLGNWSKEGPDQGR